MNKKTKYFKALTNLVLYSAAFIVFITLFPKFCWFFLPFIIGWIISLMANPIVRFFEEKIRFKRKAGSAIVIILVIAIIIFLAYGIIAFLINQGAGLIESIPNAWPQIQAALDEIGARFNELTIKLPDNMKASFITFGNNFENYISEFVGKMGTPTWVAVSNFAKSLPSTIISIIMCLLSAYFFTVDHNVIYETIEKKAPEFLYQRIQTVSRGMKKAVGGYLIAQVKIEIWIYVILVIGLLILRIDYAFAIALGIAFLDFLPFFGAGAVMVPWAVISFVNRNYFTAVGMLIIWGIGQLVRQLIQPKIVGDSIGLKPLPTLFLLYIGFEIGGVIGMLVSVPVGIIILSLYEEGVFDTFISSLKILWNGVNSFRKLTPEDKESQV